MFFTTAGKTKAIVMRHIFFKGSTSVLNKAENTDIISS